MKIRDPETIEEKTYRMNLIQKEQKDSLPKILLLIMVAVLGIGFYALNSRVMDIKVNGPGNPYNCESCKALGRACGDHRGYDKEEALQAKVYKMVSRLDYANTSEEDELNALYGYGNSFNPDCDFCKADNAECYSCSYDRKFISECINTVLDSEVTRTKYCDKCWKLGYPSEGKCYEMVTSEILDIIHKD